MPAPADDAPRMTTPDDSLTIQDPNPQPEEGAGRRQPKDLNERIRSAIAQMSADGPEAESDYQAALRAIIRDPGAPAAIAASYRSTPEDQYVARWAHTHLLSELRDKEALSALDSIVSTPIPPEKAPDMITYSTVGEEAMIRTTAIEGITRLALAGDRQALELLSKHIGHENLSVRRAAVQGYIEAAGPDAREELRKRLPEADRFLVDIRRIDVQQAPQATVERPSEEKERLEPPQPRTRLRPTIEE